MRPQPSWCNASHLESGLTLRRKAFLHSFAGGEATSPLKAAPPPSGTSYSVRNGILQQLSTKMPGFEFTVNNDGAGSVNFSKSAVAAAACRDTTGGASFPCSSSAATRRSGDADAERDLQAMVEGARFAVRFYAAVHRPP
ncbi:hypothetical protein DL767_003062 [Monosporascus sp. MG133]|nr:hypothetical protein DL767_003062 [Monosporascus sp. MG133]